MTKIGKYILAGCLGAMVVGAVALIVKEVTENENDFLEAFDYIEEDE